MVTRFPEDLDSFDNPRPDSSQSVVRTHSQQHSDANDAIEAVQRKIGSNDSSEPDSLDFKVGAQENFIGGLVSPDGAELIGFSQQTLNSQERQLGEKLRTEVRSILDFVPATQKSQIIDGTSQWDASDVINHAMRELGGGEILIPKGARLAIASPIDMPRGTVLRGGATFDTAPGVGAKIFLLPGSNCPMLRTPLASGDGGPTHFMGLENLLFDGNKINQTVESIAVQFYGAFVGSWLRNICILNTLGTSLDFRGGTDVAVSHLWVVGATVGNGYAVDMNQDLSGNALSGLLQMDNVYIENTGTVVGVDPKTNPEVRGKNLRLRRLASASIANIHTEGAANAIDIDQCHIVDIGKITGANIGRLDVADPALVRFLNASTRAVRIGPMFLGQVTGTPHIVRKASGVVSNFIPDVPYTTNPYVAGYECHSDRAYGYKRQLQTSFANQAAVARIGGFSFAAWNLINGQPDDATAPRSYLRDLGTGPRLGSTINQTSNNEKDFISVTSVGTGGDRIDLSDPIVAGQRMTAQDVLLGSVYRLNSSAVGGTALVYQRISGQNSAADSIVTCMRGSGAPSMSAEYLGQEYLDTSARRSYKAVNTGTGAADWKPITA